MALRDQPYFPFYVNDYLSDEKIRQCDPSSEGIYIRILCNMHKSKLYGKIEITPFDEAKLKQNLSKTISKIEANDEQKKMLDYLQLRLEDIALMSLRVSNMIGRHIEQVFSALIDLIGNDVLQIDGLVLSQKRMVKDGAKSEIRSQCGRRGGVKSSKNNDPIQNYSSSKSEAKDEANGKQNTEYENEYENILGKEVVGEKPFQDWRNNFNSYSEWMDRELSAALLDEKWLRTQQEIHPEMDIGLSLKKACCDFWGTEEGWKHKKASKSERINWRNTFSNSLTVKSNQVKKQESFNPRKTYF